MWLATMSLLTVWQRMPVSGAEIAPCLLALVIAHLPLCLWSGRGLYAAASSPLVIAQSFVL